MCSISVAKKVIKQRYFDHCVIVWLLNNFSSKTVSKVAIRMLWLCLLKSKCRHYLFLIKIGSVDTQKVDKRFMQDFSLPLTIKMAAAISRYHGSSNYRLRHVTEHMLN